MSILRQLRPHQEIALDGLKTSLVTGHRRPVLQLPTGAGKTVIAAHIVDGALRKRNRIAFCVPTIGLVDQTFERFVENGIDPSAMGVMQADHHWRRSHAPVQIATAQTLARRSLPDVGVVVIDECHVQHKVYQTWMGLPEWHGKPFIGLSATPWAKGMAKHWDDLIKPIGIADLIAGEYLSKFRVFAPSKPDLSGVRTVAGDYHEGDLAERMNQPKLVADIVETWMARGEGRPTLCFCVDRNHARSVHDEFASVGVPVAYVDANTPREERTAIGQQLAAGTVKVVCNIGTLTTGIDWDVRCLILARPTKSAMLFVQIIGRALRTAEGKADAIILDHSDTHMRLGMVTDIDRDALCDGSADKAAKREREDKTPLPKCCPSCSALMPVGEKTCLACGHEMQRPRVAVADGELVEFGIGRAAGKVRDSVAAALRSMGRAEVYGQLLHIARSKGRKDGWAAYKYQALFGSMPNRQSRALIAPCSELLSWVRSQDIAWAKSRPRESDAEVMARVARDLTTGASHA